VNWEEGLSTLMSLEASGLCAKMAQGDIINMMLGTLWETPGKQGAWLHDAEAKIASAMRCSVRYIQELRHVSAAYDDTQVARDPMAANQFHGAWSLLRVATRFLKPWAAVEYALDNELSVAEFAKLQQVITEDGTVYIRRPEVQIPSGAGTLRCPHCDAMVEVKNLCAQCVYRRRSGSAPTS